MSNWAGKTPTFNYYYEILSRELLGSLKSTWLEQPRRMSLSWEDSKRTCLKWGKRNRATRHTNKLTKLQHFYFHGICLFYIILKTNWLWSSKIPKVVWNLSIPFLNRMKIFIYKYCNIWKVSMRDKIMHYKFQIIIEWTPWYPHLMTRQTQTSYRARIC